MTDHSPFDPERDGPLGEALREALATPGDAAFVTGVLARLDEPTPWWEVLGGWAGPGLAAAALLVVAAGVWRAGTGAESDGPVAIDEVLAQAAGNGTMSALIASSPPDIGLLFVGTDQRE